MEFIKKHFKTILLLLVILLAFGLRFYKLGDIPVSLYWDEVALGYNAYSITETGRDEHGEVMPLLFKSFGEYKMPAYVYIIAVSEKIFGVNEFAVRFPSAAFGVFAVLLTYLLVKELFTHISYGGKRSDLLKNHAYLIALTAALLLAVSPWHIQFSRIGFEANGLLTVILLGFWLLFKSFSNQRYFILSMITLATSFYFYRAAIVFVPPLLGITGIVFFKSFLKRLKKRTILIGILLFGLVALPMVYVSLTPEGLRRTNQVSIFKPEHSKSVLEFIKKQQESNSPIARIVYNRRVAYLFDAATGYSAHFSPEYLFLKGDSNPRHHVGEMGMLYMWTIPFLLIGVLVLWERNRYIAVFVLAWLLLGPVPAALSIPSPHALRSLTMLPMPQILTAVGLVFLFYRIPVKFRVFYSLILVILTLASFGYYLFQYYGRYPGYSSEVWGDGHRQLVQSLKKDQGRYDKIVVSGHYWQPYIYFLFFNKYDPQNYLDSGSNREFDKYKFGGTSWDKEAYSQELDSVDLIEFAESENALIALTPLEYNLQKDHIDVLYEIKNRDNRVVFIVGTPKE